jgi:hypothetical protein
MRYPTNEILLLSVVCFRKMFAKIANQFLRFRFLTECLMLIVLCEYGYYPVLFSRPLQTELSYSKGLGYIGSQKTCQKEKNVIDYQIDKP